MPGTVTVYCNVPMGLRLRMHAWDKSQELVMGGGAREVKVARPTGDEVVINGTAAPHGQARKDARGNFVLIVNGFAATSGVPKDFWDAWCKQNADHAALTHNPPLMFAHEDATKAQDEAADRVGVRSGMEPLVPTLQDGTGRVIQSDPRSPRGIARHEGERAA